MNINKTCPASDFMILPIIILPLLLLPGCSPPAASPPPTPFVPVAEQSLKQQISAVRAGSTDIILIESTPLADADLSALVDVPGLRILQLDHEENSLTDTGMIAIAQLTQIEHLRIRGGSIGDEGLKTLSKMPNLKILNLPQGQFTDRGLAELRQLPRLDSLRIGSPSVTDAGIATFKDFPALRSIHLIDIPITDRGLTDLLAIPRLNSLYLDGAKITDAAVDQMFAKHPHLHVHFNQAHHDSDPNKHDH